MVNIIKRIIGKLHLLSRLTIYAITQAIPDRKLTHILADNIANNSLFIINLENVY